MPPAPPAPLEIGLEHELHFRVPPTKTVPRLYPEAAEFRRMPRVFATGFLVGLLEWACMQLLHPRLDRRRQLSVGTHIDVSHGAATPPGLLLRVHAQLVDVQGRRLTFAVQADDGIDVVSRGRHERCIIDRAAFAERVLAKATAAQAYAAQRS
jgi:fluoroacetyl-CoA thioesterase